MNKKNLWHGAAYYPELWPEKTIDEDIRLMSELGLNIVRMGEFAWSSMEPREGTFEFGWLRRTMDKLHAAGIGTVLCTPTAAPPVWILEDDPDIGYLDREGRRHRHGGRQHACYSHLKFRAHSRRITRALAEALGDHPGLVAWQTDNEFRCHQTICVCDACRSAWSRWLERRYGDIATLNTLWITALWSQTYDHFDQVPVAYRTAVGSHNFSLELAYRRFQSDTVVEFQQEQLDIIRQSSRAPIGHNFMILDQVEQNRNLDFVGSDIYTAEADTLSRVWEYDWMRALKPRVPFKVIECGADAHGYAAYGAGFLRAQQFLTYTAGADHISYWLWRQQPSGVEMEHTSLLYACGKPRRAWSEVAAAETLRKTLEPLLARFSPAPARVALVRSDRHGRFLLEDGMNSPSPDFNYWAVMQGWHRALLHTGLQRDVVYDTELSPADYSIVFSPYLVATAPDFLARMLAAVRAGCHWILGPHSGYRTQENTPHTGAILGPLEAALRFETLQREPGTNITIQLADGTTSTTSGRLCVFAGDECEVLGRYTGGSFAGGAWAVARSLGAGRIVVLGGDLPQEDRNRLARHWITGAGIEPLALPEGVILNHLIDPAGTPAWALTNWTSQECIVDLPAPCRDALDSRSPEGTRITLPPYGVCFAVPLVNPCGIGTATRGR